MKRIRTSACVVGVLLMGFLGGAACQWLTSGSPAYAADPATAPAAGERVVVRELVLVDDQGRQRGTLTVSEAGPVLVLCDEAGQTRLELGQMVITADPHETTDWYGLALHDAKGTNRFTCGAQTDGSGSGMGVWDNNGTLRYGLGFSDQGNGGITMNDTQGRQRFGIGMAAETGYGMFMKNEMGETIWTAAD